MIEHYFLEIEKLIGLFSCIHSYQLTKKIYNLKQGYIKGEIIFENGFILEFAEVKNTELNSKIKYRYQLMDKDRTLIFRYDNAPHHKQLATFPHHKHVEFEQNVIESCEPTLLSVLLEIKSLP